MQKVCWRQVPLTSNTASAITLEQIVTTPPSAGLLSFAVYSQEKTILSSQSVFNGGGAVGSNTEVEVQSGAVAGDLQFSDSSEVVFADKGYVPFARFYSNSATTVRIGCDVKFNGTLTVPHGHIAMFSRAQVSGAIYGKTITVEPQAVIMSDMTDPEADSDGDGLQNLLEVIIGTDPTDPQSYKRVAIPSRVLINNSDGDTDVVIYDYSLIGPGYQNNKQNTVKIPDGTLISPYYAPVFYVANTPDGVYEDVPGEVRVGAIITIGNEVKIAEGKSIIAQVPNPGNGLIDLFPRMFTSGITPLSIGYPYPEPPSANADADAPAPITVIINNAVKSIGFFTTAKETAKTVYFDGGYVYSSNPQSALYYMLSIKKSDNDHVNKVTMYIEYIDMGATPEVAITFSDEVPLKQGFYSLTGKLFNNDKMRIMKFRLLFEFDNGDANKMYTATFDNGQVISSAQTAFLNAVHYDAPIQWQCETSKFISQPDNGNLVFFSAWLDDVTFEAAGFGNGRFTNAPSGAGYNYEYFLTDHLGSTRMVLNDEGDVTEAIHYQQYGTIASISPSNPEMPVREKFTTKEFDEEGGSGNGTDGIRGYHFGARVYDPEIGVWGSVDAVGQYFNPYGYSTNPVLMVDEDGNFFLLPIAVIGFGIGYVRAGLRTGEWGLSSVKAGLWTGGGAALAFSPLAPYVIGGMMALQGTMTAVSNQASGADNFAQFGLGAMEGLFDYGNMATMGLANKPISDMSGMFRGAAYNQAHGITGERARINIDESRKMNKLFGAYPGQGSLIKYGSDLAWRSFHGGGNDRYMYARAKRLYGENPKGAEYENFKNSYGYKSGKYYHGQRLPQLGHALMGTISSHEAWYDGFETYGEPWVKWETQDEWDDRGIFYYMYRLYDENKNGDWGDYAND